MNDGRGQLLPLPWWGRAGRWVLAHPLVGVILALLATVGWRGLRIRHLEARQAKAQRDADLAGLKRRRLEEAAREKAAGKRLTELDRQLEEADARQAEGMAQAERAHRELEEIAKRWPAKR